jgi:hypothetical protein
MIKSKVVEKDKLEFPKLMVTKVEGTIVLMFSEHAGTVVGNTGDCQSEIGFYSGCWNSKGLDDFDGTIELSNEK